MCLLLISHVCILKYVEKMRETLDKSEDKCSAITEIVRQGRGVGVHRKHRRAMNL
jgi:hypothetical protein